MSTTHPSSPWRRIDEARPLVAWGDAQRTALAQLLDGALRAWRSGWGLPQAAACASCGDAREQDLAAAWECIGAAEAGSAWLALPPGFDDALSAQLWGTEGPVGPIAKRLTLACRADLQARLRGALCLGSAARVGAPLPTACGAWSGLLCATLGGDTRVLLDSVAAEQALRSCAPELVRRVPVPADPLRLASVTTALGGVRLALRARLADCELDLASLQDLRIGDVVPVAHRLDAPVLVHDAQDEVVFAGYLARQGRQIALELAAPATSPLH